MHPEAASRAELRQRLQRDFDSTPAEDPTSALAVQIAGSHYKEFKIQPVVFIEENNLPFLEACVIKRMCRHSNKNGAEDLRKAIHEITLLLELRYGEKP